MPRCTWGPGWTGSGSLCPPLNFWRTRVAQSTRGCCRSPRWGPFWLWTGPARDTERNRERRAGVRTWLFTANNQSCQFYTYGVLVTNAEKAHWGGFFGLGDTQQLSGVESLLQDPLVADTDWNQGHVKHFAFQERIQHYVQQACKWTGHWEEQSAFCPGGHWADNQRLCAANTQQRYPVFLGVLIFLTCKCAALRQSGS